MTGRRALVASGIALGLCLTAGLAACTGSSSRGPSASAGQPRPTASGAVASTGVPSVDVTSPSPRASTRRSSGSTSALPTSAPGPLTTVPTRAVSTLPAVPLRSTAAFGTGVAAAVTAITHGVDRDRGPGAQTGRPTVEFHLRLTNGTRRRLAVSTVEVQATYGTSATPAIAAASGTQPFTGTIAPSGAQEAVYAFAVPETGQKRIRVTISYKAGKPTVLLTGSAR